jgi:hypothetical protein
MPRFLASLMPGNKLRNRVFHAMLSASQSPFLSDAACAGVVLEAAGQLLHEPVLGLEALGLDVGQVDGAVEHGEVDGAAVGERPVIRHAERGHRRLLHEHADRLFRCVRVRLIAHRLLA